MKKRAFTLTELLIVIMIVGIMVGLALSGMAGAVQLAREQRTRAIIAKVDQLISERYEEYRTRAVPLKSPGNPQIAAKLRLYALRDLMRMELPDRVTDVSDGPAVLAAGASIPAPSEWKSYQRTARRNCGTTWATGGWTPQYQGSECLYMILSRMHDGDKNAIDYFLPGEIGDTDGDGMKEILDAWGNPIEFLRWAPAYTTENGALTTQTSNYTAAPDYFDPAKADPRWLNAASLLKPYSLKPLIFSAGPDKQYDISTRVTANGNPLRYSQLTIPDDPYFQPPSVPPLGMPFDADGDGGGWTDNITNHWMADR